LIRIFVGCAANHEDAESQAVLEYSIRKHSSVPVEITWMRLSLYMSSPFYSDRESGWQTQKWATPFSGFRWAVPALAGYEGLAIYMDSDVMVQADVAELWGQEFMPARIVMAKGGGASWRYCVSLWDCARAKRFLPPLETLMADPDSHRKMTALMRANPGLTQQFAGNWNCLDGEHYDSLDDPDIKAIHYTSMPHQPQIPLAQARLAKDGRKHWFDGTPTPHFRDDVKALFDRLYAEAEAEGYTAERYCTDPIFGEYRKKSVASLKGAVPGWGRKKPGNLRDLPADADLTMAQKC
jgi:hypothetical protein